ncbi:hypothetical protein NL676_002773 [Syzygium grande]|nr:hypothetical protein NL676_002773 [Syzygium grande]
MRHAWRLAKKRGPGNASSSYRFYRRVWSVPLETGAPTLGSTDVIDRKVVKSADEVDRSGRRMDNSEFGWSETSSPLLSPSGARVQCFEGRMLVKREEEDEEAVRAKYQLNGLLAFYILPKGKTPPHGNHCGYTSGGPRRRAPVTGHQLVLPPQ